MMSLKCAYVCLEHGSQLTLDMRSVHGLGQFLEIEGIDDNHLFFGTHFEEITRLFRKFIGDVAMKWTLACTALVALVGLSLSTDPVAYPPGYAPLDTSDISGEKFVFETQVNRVMKLIINSLYKSKDIFLRELISVKFCG